VGRSCSTCSYYWNTGCAYWLDIHLAHREYRIGCTLIDAFLCTAAIEQTDVHHQGLVYKHPIIVYVLPCPFYRSVKRTYSAPTRMAYKVGARLNVRVVCALLVWLIFLL